MVTYKELTLMVGSLAITSIQYKKQLSQNALNKISLKITTSSSHGLRGSLNIQLTNCAVYNVNDVSDYFNSQLINFQVTGSNTLETDIFWNSGNFDSLPASYNFTNLPNNGTTITVAVNQPSYTMQQGLYTFGVIENLDINLALDTAVLSIKQKIDNTSYLAPVYYSVSGTNEIAFTGNITNGSPIVTNIADVSNLFVGQTITIGAGVIGADIISVGVNAITLSANANATTSGLSIKAKYLDTFQTYKEAITFNGTQNLFDKEAVISILNYTGRSTKLPIALRIS
jgi:hypothetical protein